MNLKNVVVTAFAAVGTLVLLLPESRAQNGSETKKGSWEKIKVHGKSLEGNLEGDSPDRDVFVTQTKDAAAISGPQWRENRRMIPLLPAEIEPSFPAAARWLARRPGNHCRSIAG
jgi:hypothetical protein